MINSNRGDKGADEEASAIVRRLTEFIRKEVADWDDEVKASARFKDFNGQRCDWEPLYIFWKDLILKVAGHLGVFIIRPSELKNIWFHREGLYPLCLDRVLLEMCHAGYLLRNGDLVNPTSGLLSQMFQKLVRLVRLPRPSTEEDLAEDFYILSALLKKGACAPVTQLQLPPVLPPT